MSTDLFALGTIAADVWRHIAAGHDLTDPKLSADIDTLRVNLDRVRPITQQDPTILLISATTAETLRVIRAVFNVPSDDGTSQAAIDAATAAVLAADQRLNETTQEVTK